ncbi:MAG: hypothetical protein ABIE43_01190 [Patescibacteria group bacterium]
MLYKIIEVKGKKIFVDFFRGKRLTGIEEDSVLKTFVLLRATSKHDTPVRGNPKLSSRDISKN